MQTPAAKPTLPSFPMLQPKAVFDLVDKAGLEGMVSKRRTSARRGFAPRIAAGF